ncbi:dimethylarginine dimethylaminohydrolase family protein [Nonomuraea sp. SYSU D8015]|uniref:dimethylarginine dimethylaminohydrolase family protein n=1 Tax=Nonomuraea sp. SYSU D8015 TaxID=2593644 RepID=UPI0016601685|nr:arginine deiminase family protein [Nonomuraea sp. SYSU D8015]
MSPKTTGSELPSTFGGPGWSQRAGSHAEEVAAGQLWTTCGYRSETAPLRAVLLAWPPDSFAEITRYEEQLMVGPVDLAAMRAQTETIAETCRRNGVEVHLTRPAASPNVVFMRDLFFMTPEGALIARTASQQRAGEERHAAAALAQAGYPILRTVAGTATFEGADALWIDETTVLVGTGFRTNAGGAQAVREVLAPQGVRVLTTPLRPGVQHLLGTVMFVDERLAAVHAAACGPELRALLREHGHELIEVPADDELLVARGMNMLVLGPRRLIMPSRAPAIRRRLEAAGVEVQELEIGEYVRAAGGLACLTGILRRG